MVDVISSKWIPGGPADIPHHEQRFLHPDGPQLGKFWNKQNCVAFEKLKLTNSRKPSQRDQVPNECHAQLCVRGNFIFEII